MLESARKWGRVGESGRGWERSEATGNLLVIYKKIKLFKCFQPNRPISIIGFVRTTAIHTFVNIRMTFRMSVSNEHHIDHSC